MSKSTYAFSPIDLFSYPFEWIGTRWFDRIKQRNDWFSFTLKESGKRLGLTGDPGRFSSNKNSKNVVSIHE
jgi:hypothetical protein